jgi:23S rRNA (uracil1939-C5)-methyltransferase
MTRVLTLRVPHIAYMSCNPATLGRDLVTFAAAGYRVEKVFCADFFPHTPHMEALAFLSL